MKPVIYHFSYFNCQHLEFLKLKHVKWSKDCPSFYLRGGWTSSLNKCWESYLYFFFWWDGLTFSSLKSEHIWKAAPSLHRITLNMFSLSWTTIQALKWNGRLKWSVLVLFSISFLFILVLNLSDHLAGCVCSPVGLNFLQWSEMLVSDHSKHFGLPLLLLIGIWDKHTHKAATNCSFQSRWGFLFIISTLTSSEPLQGWYEPFWHW